MRDAGSKDISMVDPVFPKSKATSITILDPGTMKEDLRYLNGKSSRV